MAYVRMLVLAAVAFVAYTLGARAGRRSYRHIKHDAKSLWGSSGARLARTTARRGARRAARRLTR